jgi:hypothetical protein
MGGTGLGTGNGSQVRVLWRRHLAGSGEGGTPSLAGSRPRPPSCRPYGACDRSCCLPTTYVVGFTMPPLRGSFSRLGGRGCPPDCRRDAGATVCVSTSLALRQSWISTALRFVGGERSLRDHDITRRRQRLIERRVFRPRWNSPRLHNSPVPLFVGTERSRQRSLEYRGTRRQRFCL